jgi:hypothetical protein
MKVAELIDELRKMPPTALVAAGETEQPNRIELMKMPDGDVAVLHLSLTVRPGEWSQKNGAV